MKPHPSIFSAALQLVGVRPSEAVMVGDSVREDVEGALGAGMRAVLVHRSASPHPGAVELAARGVPVIRSLRELTHLVIGIESGDSLSWRPLHGAPTKQVQMDVKDRLASVAVRVEDRPITASGDAPFPGDGCGAPRQFPDNLIVARRQVVERCDVPLRHQKHVRRRLRVDVVEREHTIVLVDDRAGNLSTDDLAEQAVGHGCPSMSSASSVVESLETFDDGGAGDTLQISPEVSQSELVGAGDQRLDPFVLTEPELEQQVPAGPQVDCRPAH